MKNQYPPTPSSTPPVDPCEECFTDVLNQIQINDIFPITNPNLGNANNLEELCDFLDGLTITLEKVEAGGSLFGLLSSIPSISSDEVQEIVACLQQLGMIIIPT